MKKQILALLAGSVTLLVLPAAGGASGFALLEQSAKGLGEAMAGGATETDEPNSIFYNPAGIAFMDSDGVSAGLSAILIKAEYTDRGSYDILGAPLQGPDATSDRTGWVPNLFVAFKLSDTVSAGFGLTAPFGLGTNYPRNWVGRYHAVKTDLKTINLSPAAAWQVVPGFLSIGGAVNIQYVDAELTNAVDFGTILYPAAGTPPQSLDGFADLNGDAWGVGYSLGILCRPTETTKIGLNYRSKVKQTLKGDVKFEVPAVARAILNAGGMTNYFVNTDADADLTTPASLSLGAAQMLGDDFEIKADLSWTGWNCFRELAVEFDSSQPDAITTENWTDTYRVSLGLDWYVTEAITLRAGTSYDDTPISQDYRTPRIPDNNRIWLSLGAGVDLTEDLTVDLAYLHLFMEKMDATLTSAENASKGFMVGEYEPSIDVFSAEISYRF